MKRRPGKTLVLIGLLFILGNVISGAISIQQAVQNTDTNLRASLSAVATIEQDVNAGLSYMDTNDEFPMIRSLSRNLLISIGDLPYVQASVLNGGERQMVNVYGFWQGEEFRALRIEIFQFD